MSQVSPPDRKIKQEKKRKPPKKITENYLHNSGLYYLERFAASSAHFRKVMMRKIDRSCAHHEDQDREKCIALLDELIEKFRRAGLLDDKAYAGGMVNSMRRRGLSARMIKAKLQTKGLTSTEIEMAMDNHAEENAADAELVAAIKHARRKKIGPYARLEIPENKALAAMARAGFAYETARRVLEMPMEEAEELSAGLG